MTWKLVAVGVAIVAVLWFWNMWQDAGRQADEYVCELQGQGECVYDNRFEEWVPRSEAR